MIDRVTKQAAVPAARQLYDELSDRYMTWVDAVFWLAGGAVLGGLFVWAVS